MDSSASVVSEGGFARPLEIPRDPVPGVNLVGFLEGELGLGELARKLGRALSRAEIPTAAIPYRRVASRQAHPVEFATSDTAPYDTNLICLNADHLHVFAADAGLDLFAGRSSIGVWFWEASVFRPAERAALRFLDEVWVPSEYVRRAVEPGANVPVHVVPIPVEERRVRSRSRAELGLPTGFLFLFVFDFVSAQRKNPLAVVDAFRRAFGPEDGASLVLKSINGRERKPHLLEELTAAAAGRPDIQVRDGYVSVEERDALFAASDCYVSLHRSEGFGLTMAEAMSHAKPVIATGYSGNLDFMSDDSAYLVPYRLVPIPADWWAYSPDAEWAEPDIESACRLMRLVYENQTEARFRGALGREDVLRRFSIARSAEFVTERLEAMRERSARRDGAGDMRRPVLEASQRLAEGVGAALAPGGRGPSAVLRRALRRALWPQLARQHRLDGAILEALDALQRSHDDLREQISQATQADASSPAEDVGQRDARLP